jgi:hypothetical protein
VVAWLLDPSSAAVASVLPSWILAEIDFAGDRVEVDEERIVEKRSTTRNLTPSRRTRALSNNIPATSSNLLSTGVYDE